MGAEPKVLFSQSLLPIPNQEDPPSYCTSQLQGQRILIPAGERGKGCVRGRQGGVQGHLAKFWTPLVLLFALNSDCFLEIKQKDTASIVENLTSAGHCACSSVPIASGPSLPFLSLSAHVTTPTHNPPSHKLISSLHLKIRILADLCILFIQFACVPASVQALALSLEASVSHFHPALLRRLLPLPATGRPACW